MAFNIPDQWVEIPIIGQWLHDAVAAIPRVAQSILLEFKDLIPLVGRGMGALLRGLSSQLLQAILTRITFFFFLKEGEVILASIIDWTLIALPDHSGHFWRHRWSFGLWFDWIIYWTLHFGHIDEGLASMGKQLVL